MKLILGGREPIGVRVRHQPDSETAQPGPWLEIVGVVKDLGAAGDKITEDAMLYRPAAPGGDAAIQVIVRGRGAAKPLSQAVGAAAAAADPALRLYDLNPLDEIHRQAMEVHRLMAQAIAVVAAVALLLATAGVYALMSFTLARRTREIGIRVALGAAPRHHHGVFSRAFTHVGIGVLAGAVPGFVIVTNGVEHASVARTATGIALMLVVCALVVVVATLACAPPLRRALRIEPTQALKAE